MEQRRGGERCMQNRTSRCMMQDETARTQETTKEDKTSRGDETRRRDNMK